MEQELGQYRFEVGGEPYWKAVKDGHLRAAAAIGAKLGAKPGWYSAQYVDEPCTTEGFVGMLVAASDQGRACRFTTGHITLDDAAAFVDVLHAVGFEVRQRCMGADGSIQWSRSKGLVSGIRPTEFDVTWTGGQPVLSLADAAKMYNDIRGSGQGSDALGSAMEAWVRKCSAAVHPAPRVEVSPGMASGNMLAGPADGVRYVVKDGHTLGCMQEGSTSMGVIAGDVFKGGHDWKNGPVAVLPGTTELRPATREDFERFRVSPAGYFEPERTGVTTPGFEPLPAGPKGP